MPDAIIFDHDLLRKYLEAYREDLPKFWPNEKYKWESVTQFQQNWNAGVPDFAAMLERALPENNLFVSVNYFPRSMLLAFAKEYPQELLSMFRELYDESMPIASRIDSFKESTNEILAKIAPDKRSYQNTNAISSYLWLKFPEKYYIYKYTYCKNACTLLKCNFSPKLDGSGNTVANAYAFYNDINMFMRQDMMLTDAINRLIDESPSCYRDTQLRTLTTDFIYYLQYYYPQYHKSIIGMNDEKTLSFRYWWLVANPRIWNFADLPTGKTQTYTALNENGNKRRVYQNFVDAAVGDKLVGYVSQPQKKLVALCTITAKDGDNIIFRKDEQLADPISYAELKDMPELASMQFFQNSNGSLFSLTEKEASALMDCIRERNPRPAADAAPPYTAEDFCREVYMTPERHVRLRNLLQRQKNIILQGPPGVGKTYAARRLAWSVMECKDDSRITMVQFHQNYAYEDFVMGYRPDGAGFVLREGVFYQACKRAANDAGRPHFFIIDEINRGNLSRIFGELLMLLENGHRGESLPLPYNGERFSVPPNLHVIGMMNTADRSLALMDYALRRRFGFCAMPPGFGSAGFSAYLESLGDKPKLRALVEAVKKLNEAISEDASLGRGYCVGHSYFCGMQPEEVTDERLADIVECDLLPLLEEYWFDDADKRRQWEHVLKGALS